jgi:hypothetical protein
VPKEGVAEEYSSRRADSKLCIEEENLLAVLLV